MSEEFSKDLLSAYIDEELTLAERAEVERELHTDPMLREELEQLSQLSALLGDLKPDVAPEELFPSVIHQIERELLLGTKSSPQVAKPHKNYTRLLAGILLVIAACIVVAIRFPLFNADPEDAGKIGNNATAKNDPKTKKKTIAPIVKNKKSKAAIIAANKTPITAKRPVTIPLKWDEIIASLDYTNNRTAVIEFDADDDKELLKKIQQILSAGKVSSVDKSSAAESANNGIQSVYFEGSAEQLQETLQKLTQESWWKDPTLRGSVNPQTVQLAKIAPMRGKQERVGIQSLTQPPNPTLLQKIAQTRQKLQPKRKQLKGARIQSLTNHPNPKKKQKPRQFQMPIQIDKAAWEKSRPKEIKPQKKTAATAKNTTQTLRILIVIKKK